MAIKNLKPGQDFEFPREFGFSGSAQGRHDPRPHPNHNAEYGDGLAKGGRARRKGYQIGGPVQNPAAAQLPPQAAQAARVAPGMTRQLPPQAMARPGLPPQAMGRPGMPPQAGGAPVPRPNPALGTMQLQRAAQLGAATERGFAKGGYADGGRPRMVTEDFAKKAALGALRAGTAMGAKAARQLTPPEAAIPGPRPNLPSGGLVNPNMPTAAKGGKFLQKAIKHRGRLTQYAKRLGVSKMAAAKKAAHSSNPSVRGMGILGERLIGGDLKKGRSRK